MRHDDTKDIDGLVSNQGRRGTPCAQQLQETHKQPNQEDPRRPQSLPVPAPAFSAPEVLLHCTAGCHGCRAAMERGAGMEGRGLGRLGGVQTGKPTASPDGRDGDICGDPDTALQQRTALCFLSIQSHICQHDRKSPESLGGSATRRSQSRALTPVAADQFLREIWERTRPNRN